MDSDSADETVVDISESISAKLEETELPHIDFLDFMTILEQALYKTDGSSATI